MSRRVPITLAELFDRLTILQIKEVLDPRNYDSYARELDEVVAAIDAATLPLKRQLDVYLIRLIVALAEVNVHIWYVKEGQQQSESMMKLGHQLNGIRNQVKNLIAHEFGVTAPAQKKTNDWTENLRGWSMSVTRGRAAVEADIHHDASRDHGGADRASGRTYEFLLTDLIDALTIAQIKETLFPDDKKFSHTTELADLSSDIETATVESPRLFSGRIARLIIFLAQANLHVWHGKDEMHRVPDRYDHFLHFAADMNGLRNHTRNLLMEEFGESDPAKRKTTFLDFERKQWYSGLLSSLGTEDGIKQTY